MTQPALDEQVAQTAPELEGFELDSVRTAFTRKENEKNVFLYLPIGPATDLKPADAYKDAVAAIAPAPMDERYLLLASVRKLAEHNKALTVVDFSRYTHAGINSPTVRDEAAAQKLLKDNFEEHKQTLETALVNIDAAFDSSASPTYPVVVTPPHVLDASNRVRMPIPDREGNFLKQARAIQEFLGMYCPQQDTVNFIQGKRLYVTRIDDEGRIKELEIWKKKEA